MQRLLDTSGEGTVLERVDDIQRRLNALGLELLPAITRGGLEDIRVLRPIARTRVTASQIVEEISLGESFRREFKASLRFDRERAQHDPAASTRDLCSEDVQTAALRAIAAFMNSDGGVLLVGVADWGEIVGIEDDYQYCGGDVDGWQLHLRNVIEGRFKDGRMINDHVRVGFVTAEDHTVARVEVSRRGALCYLNVGSRLRAYRRQGNRSAEIGIDELIAYDRQREVAGLQD